MTREEELFDVGNSWSCGLQLDLGRREVMCALYVDVEFIIPTRYLSSIVPSYVFIKNFTE
jgi:hypothetical protein